MLKSEATLIKTVTHLLLFVLVVYVAYLVAKVTWFSMAPTNELDVIVLPENMSVAEKRESSYVRLLPKFHLFGEAGKVLEKPKNVEIVAPKTNLRLLLKGVFTAKEGGSSGAIIEEMGKSAEYYALGAVLPGNAVLEEVYEDRVLLRRNGRLETLSFDEKGLDTESTITKSTKPRIATKGRSGIVEPEVKTPEQFIDEATRQISENPEQALKSVGLSASNEGYIYQGGNPMLSGLNLKKGDVIRSVNGHNVGDVKKDKNLMQSLYEQGNLEVEIVRDGASFYINYPLR